MRLTPKAQVWLRSLDHEDTVPSTVPGQTNLQGPQDDWATQGSPHEMLLSREGLCVLVPGPDPSTRCTLRPTLSFLPVTDA